MKFVISHILYRSIREDPKQSRRMTLKEGKWTLSLDYVGSSNKDSKPSTCRQNEKEKRNIARSDQMIEEKG